jgi:hypothetical protein
MLGGGANDANDAGGAKFWKLGGIWQADRV